LRLEVTIDQLVCIGAGMCVQLAPEVFAIDDEGVAFVVSLAAAEPELLRRAERSCPTGAIEVLEASART
jgi:ferredoxin